MKVSILANSSFLSPLKDINFTMLQKMHMKVHANQCLFHFYSIASSSVELVLESFRSECEYDYPFLTKYVCDRLYVINKAQSYVRIKI